MIKLKARIETNSLTGYRRAVKQALKYGADAAHVYAAGIVKESVGQNSKGRLAASFLRPVNYTYSESANSIRINNVFDIRKRKLMYWWRWAEFGISSIDTKHSLTNARWVFIQKPGAGQIGEGIMINVNQPQHRKIYKALLDRVGEMFKQEAADVMKGIGRNPTTADVTEARENARRILSQRRSRSPLLETHPWAPPKNQRIQMIRKTYTEFMNRSISEHDSLPYKVKEAILVGIGARAQVIMISDVRERRVQVITTK